jgi:hypothetical protein
MSAAAAAATATATATGAQEERTVRLRTQDSERAAYGASKSSGGGLTLSNFLMIQEQDERASERGISKKKGQRIRVAR